LKALAKINADKTIANAIKMVLRCFFICYVFELLTYLSLHLFGQRIIVFIGISKCFMYIIANRYFFFCFLL
jgi:hypothetical protein